jgi:ammonium transporter, Amt family
MDPTTLASGTDPLCTVFILVCAILVFSMQCGFAFFSAGFVRAKNSLTILAEGMVDFCVGCLAYFVGGYAIMFCTGQERWWKQLFLIEGISPATTVPLSVFWLYHAMFCTATTTIASGAFAERIKFGPYLLMSAIVSLILYPVLGQWIWGGGWLQRLGFVDLAGSTQVHLVGGIIALVGVKFLGPRAKKFGAHGRLRIIPAHSLPLSILGCFILWVGWFGFNMGSLMSVSDPEALGTIAMNTQLGGCSGCLVALFFSWIRYGKPDISMALNGALAGLVSITAGCHVILPAEAMLIGALAGLIVLYGVPYLDKLKLDDPVGAIVVHGMCGIWGTLAVGLFAGQNLISKYGAQSVGLFHGGGPRLLSIQLTGIVCVIVFTAGFSWFCLWGINQLFGLRVSKKGEQHGLDIEEFGVDSYNDFQIFSH